MASSKMCLLFLAIIFVSRSVQADGAFNFCFVSSSLGSFALLFNKTYIYSSTRDEADNLFQSINTYRKSLNLSSLTQNDNAECLAEQIAEQFKNQPCTNSTGSNTVAGTENQFSNYPDLLSHCHLNITDTRDGAILPACVPALDPSLVLTNFTKSQYSSYLNDTKYTGAGINSQGNWIVLVMTTDTSGGSFATATGDGFVSAPGSFISLLVFALSGLLLLSL